MQKTVAKKILILTFFVLLFPSHVNAQLVINEFSSSTTSDWVEIFNYSTDTINLSSYIIRDSSTNKVILNGEIAPGGIKVFNFSNRLDNSGDAVRLLVIDESQEQELDRISYGSTGEVCLPIVKLDEGIEGSIGRYPDGNSTVERFQQNTRGISNNNVQLFPCPTPSPVPTPTPTPTPKPTATPKPATIPPTFKPSTSSAATPSSTVFKSPSPTGQITPQASFIALDEQATQGSQLEVLGVKSVEKEPDPIPSPDISKSAGNHNAAVTYLMIGGGVLFCFIGIILYLKKVSKGYNEDDAEQDISE